MAAPAPEAERAPSEERDRLTLRIGRYGWALVGIALALAVIGWVLAQLSIIVIPIVLALFPAAVLAPLERWLEDRGINPTVATSLTLLIAVLVAAGIGALLTGRVTDQAGELASEIQDGYENLRDQLAEGAFGLPPVEVGDLVDRAQESLSEGGFTGQALDAASRTGRVLTELVVLLITLFFYLRDGDKIARFLRNLFPRSVRDDVSEVGARVWQAVGGYIRGQTVIALVDAVLIGIGLLILDVPLAFVLAFLVFVGAYIPVVGALLSGTVAVLVALTQSFVTALIVLALIVGVQQLEGNVLSPIIMRRAIEIHPLAVVLALTAGGALFGVLGALLSLPVAASVYRIGVYLRERLGDDPTPA